MKYSMEQLEAIRTVNTNILVSASAGAGKTGVLVARLVKRCVEDQIPITRILAVTFTQAAAAEMKKRLAKSLNEKLTNTTDAKLYEYLQNQIIQLGNANITTIDSFCLTIIQKYYNVIGLNPATTANVLAGGIKETYLQQAFDKTVKQYYQNHADSFQKLLQLLSNAGDDFANLFEIIKQIHNTAQNNANPTQWYEQVKQNYKKIHHFQQFPTIILDGFFDYLYFQLIQIQEALSTMLLYADESKKIKKELLIIKQNALQSCINAIEEKNYNCYCLHLTHFVELKTTADKTVIEYTQARNIVEGSNSLSNYLMSIRYDETTFTNDHNEISNQIILLLDFAKDVYQHFIKIKQQHAVMDFQDMERYALDILEANHHAVAIQIRDSLDEIMIDEFQDTSELQNIIIEKIAKENNVFRVGDVKQSIYRFRQAKPDLMRQLMKNSKTKTITLRNNYRSKESIVNFTNILFQKIMNVPHCKDTYHTTDIVSIGSPHQKEAIPNPVIFAKISMLEDSNEEETLENKDLKAQWIAKQILIIRQNNPTMKYKNFAVLLRSHSDKTHLKNAFDLFHIPYNIDTRQGFFNSELCQTITAFCEAMLNHHNELALLTILTSEFYQFSDQEIAELKLIYPTLYDGIQAKHPSILEDLNHLYDIAKNQSIENMLSTLANFHDFLQNLTPNQKTNFDYLFDQVIKNHFTSLYDFLIFIYHSQNENSSEAISKGKDDDVVCVTTIHQSKGLQYHTVFLWSNNANIFSDNTSVVMVDDQFGIGLHYISNPYRIKRPTLQRLAIKHKANLEDLEEFTRILYVALTRATDNMYIVDTVKKEITPTTITLSLLSQRKGMTNLILSALDDNPYFKQIIAYPQEIENHIPKQEIENTTLPIFSHSVKALSPMIKPSQNEPVITTLPNLSFTTDGTSYGSMIHNIIEKMPNRNWIKSDFQDMDLSDTEIENLLSFSQSEIYQRALNMEIHKEYPFYLEEEQARILGIMDFVAIGTEKIILVDFKTDAKTPEEMLQHHFSQLDLYRHVLEKIFSLPVEAYIFSFHNRCTIPVPTFYEVNKKL